jgi:hypothetical protein
MRYLGVRERGNIYIVIDRPNCRHTVTNRCKPRNFRGLLRDDAFETASHRRLRPSHAANPTFNTYPLLAPRTPFCKRRASMQGLQAVLLLFLTANSTAGRVS